MCGEFVQQFRNACVVNLLECQCYWHGPST